MTLTLRASRFVCRADGFTHLSAPISIPPIDSKRRLSPLGERGISLARIGRAEIDDLRAGFVGECITKGPVGALVRQRLSHG